MVTRCQVELTLVKVPLRGQGGNASSLRKVMLMIIDHRRVKLRTRVEIDKSGRQES